MKQETADLRYFAGAPDSYAGAVIEISQRMTGGVALICGLVYLPLLVIASPPTGTSAEWLLALAAIGVTLFGGALAVLRPSWLSWDRMAAVQWVCLAALLALIWLTGRAESPFASLMVLWMVLFAACHPPRPAVVFISVAALAFVVTVILDGSASSSVGALGAQLFASLFMAGVANAWVVSIRRDRLSRMHSEQRATSLARVDQLTGLANRRAFEEELVALTARMKVEGGALSVVVVDLCRFKDINDRFGHLAGDACLRQIGEAIRGAVRADELVFRWGGDEFTVLLPGDRAEVAHQLSARLRAAIAESCRDPQGAPIEIVCGTAAITGDMDPAELVRAADIELLAGKQTVRDRSPSGVQRLGDQPDHDRSASAA